MMQIPFDASRTLLLPGLINGHLHTWQTGLRGFAADWTVAEYMQAMHRGLATLFQPEDVYIANLMGALNQINNGATTLVDWCHNNPTPEHSDAAIRCLDEAEAKGDRSESDALYPALSGEWEVPVTRNAKITPVNEGGGGRGRGASPPGSPLAGSPVTRNAEIDPPPA
jgi:hypothetical protein